MLTYTYSLANVFRNVVKMVEPMLENRTRGAIDLEEYLKLTMSPAQVRAAIQVFYSWYRKMYKPDDRENDLLLKLELAKQTPIYMCAVLNEFADTVEEIAAVSTALERAALLIEQAGWIQGQSRDPERGFCLVGAVDYTLLAHQPYARKTVQLWEASIEVLASYAQTSLLVEWNDLPGRKKEEVLNLLREAAAGVRMIKE